MKNMKRKIVKEEKTEQNCKLGKKKKEGELECQVSFPSYLTITQLANESTCYQRLEGCLTAIGSLEHQSRELHNQTTTTWPDGITETLTQDAQAPVNSPFSMWN